MSRDLDLATAAWLKSSYSSSSGGECVECSPTFTASGVVPVRDSKDPSGPALIFSATAWSSFVAALKGGEFPVA
jgi:Domain of unknown function (DUF397)